MLHTPVRVSVQQPDITAYFGSARLRTIFVISQTAVAINGNILKRFIWLFGLRHFRQSHGNENGWVNTDITIGTKHSRHRMAITHLRQDLIQLFGTVQSNVLNQFVPNVLGTFLHSFAVPTLAIQPTLEVCQYLDAMLLFFCVQSGSAYRAIREQKKRGGSARR